jgi:hypothetical protein
VKIGGFGGLIVAEEFCGAGDVHAHRLPLLHFDCDVFFVRGFEFAVEGRDCIGDGAVGVGDVLSGRDAARLRIGVILQQHEGESKGGWDHY